MVFTVEMLLKKFQEMDEEQVQRMRDRFVARLAELDKEWEEEERKRRLGMNEFLNRAYTI